jgi:spore maturation protein CgeB
MKIVVLGLSITSSWGNGHATTYRALLRGLAGRGHEILFLERDVPWYASHRDLPRPSYCRVALYDDISALTTRYADDIAGADLVVVGSYVPEGIAVADRVLELARGCTAFYDIDTPITVAALARNAGEYLERRQVPHFDLYLSFTGGPLLNRLEHEFLAQRARPLYCLVDPELYQHDPDAAQTCDLSYLGTYSDDRQPGLERLLLEPARRWKAGRFAVAGAQFPPSIAFPANVDHLEHLPPRAHPGFYNGSRFTLNLTRRDMIEAGYSPSVRLFEAAACGTPVISDSWPGLERFFRPGEEILLASSGDEVLALLRELPEAERVRIGARARVRVLAAHTSVHRAMELEGYVSEVTRRPSVPADEPIPPAPPRSW